MQNIMKREAKIIAEAGKIGMVTIATNMAGRGTDIQLGGNKNFIVDNIMPGEKEIKKIDLDKEKIKSLEVFILLELKDMKVEE